MPIRRPPAMAATQAAILAAILAAASGGAAPAAGEPAAMLGRNPGECDIARALLGTAPPGCPPAPPAARPAPPPVAAPAPAPEVPGPATATPAPASGPDTPSPATAPAGTPAAGAAAPPAAERQERRTAFLIEFDFASARIRPESRAVLDRVAAVMASPQGRGRIFRIVGHTDAVGSAAANLALSRRRAEAVAGYLTTVHGVARERLETLGRGEEELADPANPTAAVNRRVEIVTLAR